MIITFILSLVLIIVLPRLSELHKQHSENNSFLTLREIQRNSHEKRHSHASGNLGCIRKVFKYTNTPTPPHSRQKKRSEECTPFCDILYECDMLDRGAEG